MNKRFLNSTTKPDDQAGGSFKKQTRSNDTHESSTWDNARLYRKGKTGFRASYLYKPLAETLAAPPGPAYFSE